MAIEQGQSRAKLVGPGNSRSNEVLDLELSGKPFTPSGGAGGLEPPATPRTYPDLDCQQPSYEKLRMSERQRSIARENTAVKLHDLKKFAQHSKLSTPVPTDFSQLPSSTQLERERKLSVVSNDTSLNSATRDKGLLEVTNLATNTSILSSRLAFLLAPSPA